MIRACRLPMNQRKANAAPTKRELAAWGCRVPSARARMPSGTYTKPSSGAYVRIRLRRAMVAGRYTENVLRATHLQYEAGDFGVGELWLEGDRVVWAEL